MVCGKVVQHLNEEWVQKPLTERAHSEGTSRRTGHRELHSTAWLRGPSSHWYCQRLYFCFFSAVCLITSRCFFRSCKTLFLSCDCNYGSSVITIQSWPRYLDFHQTGFQSMPREEGQACCRSAQVVSFTSLSFTVFENQPNQKKTSMRCKVLVYLGYLSLYWKVGQEEPVSWK